MKCKESYFCFNHDKMIIHIHSLVLGFFQKVQAVLVVASAQYVF